MRLLLPRRLLKGPPVTRVYANLDEITAALPAYLGQGRITSRSAARAHEGTTFEASCYTDPLALEHLTGSWRRAVEHFGAWDAPVQLRWTTKYDDVGGFVGLPHAGRTRVRFSVNCLPVSERMEGGTSRVQDRLAALRDARARLTDEEARHALADGSAGNGGGHRGKQVGEAFVELRNGIGAFERRGIVLRGLDRGLIDFPACLSVRNDQI